MEAMNKLQAALDAKRREMYGENWRLYDWHGQLIEPIDKAPSNYRGKMFLDKMARKIVKHMGVTRWKDI